MKARKFLNYSILSVALTMSMASCVTTIDRPFPGDVTVENRPLRGFERVEISGSPNVVFTQADTFGVRLEGPEKMVENMVTEVKDRTLHVYNKSRIDLKVGFINLNWGDKDEVTVYVSSPDLIAVRVNGSGDFISREPVDTDEMEIVLRGSGDVDFDEILCDACTTELVGSGDININLLDARKSSAVLVGAGDITINEANVDETDLSLRGSGDITVNFGEGCKSAQCQLAGSGDIMLSGILNHYDCKKNGSGDINIGNLQIK